jgi:phosphoglycolate phosphatase
MIHEIYNILVASQSTVAIQYLREAMEIVQGMELAAARKSRLLDGVPEMLRSLAERGIKTGVVTRNCRDAVKEIFPDILSHVQAVLTRDDLMRVKPDPEHLRRILSLLEILPERAAMVGDHPMDMALGSPWDPNHRGPLRSRKQGAARGVGGVPVLEKAPDILRHLA